MPKQVIQFFDNGNVAHTRDRNLDIAGMLGGTRSINRVTDILFHEQAQGFYITFLRGIIQDWKFHDGSIGEHYLEGTTVAAGFEFKIGAEITHSPGMWIESGILMFEEYEEAVAYEIELLNHLRKIGARF